MRRRAGFGIKQRGFGRHNNLLRDRSSFQGYIRSRGRCSVNFNVIDKGFLETLGFDQDAVGNRIEGLRRKRSTISGGEGRFLARAEIRYRHGRPRHGGAVGIKDGAAYGAVIGLGNSGNRASQNDSNKSEETQALISVS